MATKIYLTSECPDVITISTIFKIFIKNLLETRYISVEFREARDLYMSGHIDKFEYQCRAVEAYIAEHGQVTIFFEAHEDKCKECPFINECLPKFVVGGPQRERSEIHFGEVTIEDVLIAMINIVRNN